MFRLNEIQCAKDLLDENDDKGDNLGNGEPNANAKRRLRPITLSDLILLAKYFDYKGEPDVRGRLKAYIISHTVDYNEVVYDKYLDIAERHIKYHQIRKNICVPLSLYEILSVLHLKGNICQRVGFCILVVSKYYFLNPSGKDCDMSQRLKQQVRFNGSWRDIFKLAQASYNRKQKEKIIMELCSAGFLELTPDYRFIVLAAKPFDKPFVSVPCDKTLLYYILRFRGEQAIICQRCGKVVHVRNSKTHRQKYCAKCSEIIRKSQTASRVQNYRSKTPLEGEESSDFERTSSQSQGLESMGKISEVE